MFLAESLGVSEGSPGLLLCAAAALLRQELKQGQGLGLRVGTGLACGGGGEVGYR